MFRRCRLSVFPNAKLRAGVLGGSFDPPHCAHLAISDMAIRVFRLHCVIWAVCARNPHKNGHCLPLDLRVQMARELSVGHKVLIGISGEYVADTIDAIKRNNPLYNLLWIMGDDSWASLRRWRRWRDVQASVPMAVFRRLSSLHQMRAIPCAGGVEFCGVSAVSVRKGSWTAVNSLPHNESSTRIRSEIMGFYDL